MGTNSRLGAYSNKYGMSLSLKEGQFLLVRAVGRIEKGGYTMGEVLSLSVDEVDRQISLF